MSSPGGPRVVLTVIGRARYYRAVQNEGDESIELETPMRGAWEVSDDDLVAGTATFGEDEEPEEVQVEGTTDDGCVSLKLRIGGAEVVGDVDGTLLVLRGWRDDGRKMICDLEVKKKVREPPSPLPPPPLPPQPTEEMKETQEEEPQQLDKGTKKSELTPEVTPVEPLSDRKGSYADVRSVLNKAGIEFEAVQELHTLTKEQRQQLCSSPGTTGGRRPNGRVVAATVARMAVTALAAKYYRKLSVAAASSSSPRRRRGSIGLVSPPPPPPHDPDEALLSRLAQLEEQRNALLDKLVAAELEAETQQHHRAQGKHPHPHPHPHPQQQQQRQQLLQEEELKRLRMAATRAYALQKENAALREQVAAQGRRLMEREKEREKEKEKEKKQALRSQKESRQKAREVEEENRKLKAALAAGSSSPQSPTPQARRSVGPPRCAAGTPELPPPPPRSTHHANHHDCPVSCTRRPRPSSSPSPRRGAAAAHTAGRLVGGKISRTYGSIETGMKALGSSGGRGEEEGVVTGAAVRAFFSSLGILHLLPPLLASLPQAAYPPLPPGTSFDPPPEQFYLRYLAEAIILPSQKQSARRDTQ